MAVASLAIPRFLRFMLERLRCGVIITGAFKEWLEEWKAREGAANFGLIPELSYVRCKEGERAGQSWVSLIWQPLGGAKPHEIFEIGSTRVYFQRQTRQALKDRCLDIKDGRIVVI
jgi:hypothetical protein